MKFALVTLFAAVALILVIGATADGEQNIVTQDDRDTLRDIIQHSPNMESGNAWQWIKCKICKEAMDMFVEAIAKHGCAFADTAAAAACEAAGLGPEDPMADLCVAAFIGGCELIAKEVVKGITNPDALCSDIDMGTSAEIKKLELGRKL